MEIDITNLIHSWLNDEATPPIEFFCSQAEMGSYAGQGSWAAAKDEAYDLLTLSDDQYAACREWFGEFGAWEDEEIAGWTREEVAALLLQFIAGDYREVMEGLDAPTNCAEYEQATESCGGRIYPIGDNFTECGWYIYVGS